jgi:hypothetical protein
MKKPLHTKVRRCFSSVKQELISKLRACDFYSDDYKEYNECYRRVAKESLQQLRDCVKE